MKTHKWRSLGNLESSEGIWPLKELLFKWLQSYRHACKTQKWNALLANLVKCLAERCTYRCLTLTKLANDFGNGPDIWFWSTWSRFNFARYPNSSGKEPESWFPFKSLHIKDIKWSYINWTWTCVHSYIFHTTTLLLRCRNVFFPVSK